MREFRSFPLLRQLPPGLQVATVFAPCSGVGIDADGFALHQGGDGDYVPGGFGDDVGHEEIDFAGGVGSHGLAETALDVDEIGSVAQYCGRLDLHPPQSLTGVEDEVVALAVSVGLGYSEAEAGGFVHEGQFREFATAFRALVISFPGIGLTDLVFMVRVLICLLTSPTAPAKVCPARFAMTLFVKRKNRAGLPARFFPTSS